jgi:hypothetical protein
MNDTISEKKELNVINNTSLPNNIIDNVSFSRRQDGLCLLRFYTNLPEGRFEQFRAFFQEQNLKEILDLLSKMLDYYPEKKKSKKIKSADTKH